MTTTETDLRATLEAHGQAHLLRFVDALDDAARNRLMEQVAGLDLALVASLADGSGPLVGSGHGMPDDLGPAAVIGLDAADARAAARDAGDALIKAGKVAAFTVAGGQGTRLGWNGPKGTFPASVVTGKPLFRLFAEQLLAVQNAAGVTIPWYIMTSPINDAATRSFMEDNNCFGLERQQIFMFPQGVMPSVDDDGKILLAAKDAVAVNPDGHGGALKALRVSGAIDDMKARGIEQISYFQVDNPTVRVIDPTFLGLHASHPDSSGEMSSKIVRKTEPGEKVGVFATSGGRTMVVEYSDLPAELAEQRDADGTLTYDGGSIAIHAMSVAFVERLTEPGGDGLPFHRARKKVPHVDLESGATVEPTEPNGIKYETFVFDALPAAERSIVVETDRVEEFAPIKNASGGDSVETSHRLQSERAARWLEARGVTVPRDADGAVDASIEIAPTTAMEPSDLDDDAINAAVVEPGGSLVL